ncbi:MAG: 5'-nucleotidase C-terminal domain-containing protein [Spirochaetia bacterium]|nr:5'-nucleotidase C-terminal domain-containing protein [Spirochaetia bacterium]
MRKRIMLGFALAATLLAIVSCASPFEKYAEEPLVITFIETSDIHGALFPYNFITDKKSDTSLAQISTLVNMERAIPGNNVVLLDNGDSLQGQPTVYYYNFEKTDVPHIWGEAMNFMGYDAVSVGNHDIEAGHAVYDKLYAEMNAPVICANAVKPDGTPYFKPYAIIERQGVKIAILGMVSPKIPEWLPPQFWTGMRFDDMVPTAQKWIPIIQKEEKPDLIIGLFHAGPDYNYGVTKPGDTVEGQAQWVIEQVPGFDMILVGHDHQGWSGPGYDGVLKKAGTKLIVDPSGKEVPIYGPTAYAAKTPVVRVSMLWDKETKSWRKSISGELVEVKSIPVDTSFMTQFQPAYDAVKDWVSRPIGKLGEKIYAKESMTGDSAFVDLVHLIQLEVTRDPANGMKPADISFTAPLDNKSIVPSSADGTLYVRDMFNLYKYENFLYTMDLTGEQVEKFMEFSYANWIATMDSPDDSLIAYKKDSEGNFIWNERYGSYDTLVATYQYDTADGIIYTVDVTKPAGNRVTIVSMKDGTPFDLKKVYSVAINSYRASGGGNHLTAGVGLAKDDLVRMKYVTGSTTKDLRFYMLKWFEGKTGVVKVGTDNNWKFIPEDLAAAGAKVSLPMMYPAP